MATRDPQMILSEIRQAQVWSASDWEDIIEDAEDIASKQLLLELYKECDSCYVAALDTLEGQYSCWELNARYHLEHALRLEQEGGVTLHSKKAIEDLEEYTLEEHKLTESLRDEDTQ